jgi:uncharacterized protein (DUF302 family)
MNAFKFQVERIDHCSSKPFEKLIAAFEEKCPLGELARLNQLATSRASKSDIEQTVGSMAGDLGFMHMAKIDQGSLVSLLGKPRKMTAYTLGNPVIASQMYEICPEVGLYAPLRVLIYEDHNGVAHITYDKPSSLLQQFQHDRIGGVARALDDKMESLAKFVVA